MTMKEATIRTIIEDRCYDLNAIKKHDILEDMLHSTIDEIADELTELLNVIHDIYDILGGGR